MSNKLECQFCLKTFKGMAGLASHLRAIHEKSRKDNEKSADDLKKLTRPTLPLLATDEIKRLKRHKAYAKYQAKKQAKKMMEKGALRGLAKPSLFSIEPMAGLGRPGPKGPEIHIRLVFHVSIEQ